MGIRLIGLLMLACSVLACSVLAGEAIGAEPGSRGGSSGNLANDDLLRLKPPERAAKLARSISQWCIGTEAFLMGEVETGPGKGNAYWSLRCADGTTWAIQVDPEAGVTAISCAEYAAMAPGKECFKKF